MLKVSCCRATVALGLASVLAISASVFAQDGAQDGAQDRSSSEPQKKVLSVESIRPFMRSETPANQAPDLYDPKSDEFNYFREDLGRSEISSKTKARLAERAARVSYVDPMDKPAADGTPFVNIYDPDEVFADGKPFVGADDPDVYYKPNENNFLAQFADGCQTITTLTTLVLGASASNANGSQDYDSSNAMGSMGSMGSMGTPMTPMMDPSVMPGSMSGSMGDAKGGATAKEKKVEPSANDDSKLLFPEAAENPFKDPVALGEKDFDLFKADREFAPKAPEPQKGSGYMMGGSMGGPGSMDGAGFGGMTPNPGK